MIIVIFLGVFFRIYPLTVNPQRKNLALAKTSLYLTIQKTIQNQIERTKPYLSGPAKQELIQKNTRAIIQKEPNRFKATSKNISKQMPHQFYLLGADPYFYHHLTSKINTTGSISKKIQNGKYYDPLMMAPKGHWRQLEAHPYLGFALFKFFRFFNPDMQLWQAESWMPIVLLPPIIILFLYLCFMLKIKKIPTLTGSIFFVLAPIFLQRSSIGWYDTDPYNILFPLLTIITLFKYQQARNKYLPLFYLSLITSVYCFFWQGWIILFLFIALYFVLQIVSALWSRKQNSFQSLRHAFFYLAFSLAFSFAFLTPPGLKSSLTETAKIFSGFLFFDISPWPDIFLTVGELKAPGIRKIIHLLGGYLFVIISFLGAITLMFIRKKQLKNNRKMAILLFFLFFFIFGKNAQRFIIFFLTPAVITFTLSLDWFQSKFSVMAGKIKPINKNYLQPISPILILLLSISPLFYAHAVATGINPVYNNTWDTTLKQIKEKTPAKSIINSWWPPGHFIKAVAQRRVSFDGATLNTQPAYWIASFLLANEQNYALGILRMLNSSGTEAVDYLTANGFTLSSTISLLKKILKTEKNTAQKIALKQMSQSKTKKLISLTHGEPAPTYCLIYKNLVDGTIGLYYVKNWDFEKTSLFKEKRLIALKKGGLFWRGTTKNISSIWEMSGGMPYVGKRSFATKTKGNTIYFENGVTLNQKKMEVKIENLEGEISGIPKLLLYLEGKKLIKKELPNANLNLSVLLIKSEESYSVVVSKLDILNSILFQLYYLDGLNLDSFDKIIDIEDPLLNTKILVYKILFK